MKKIFIFLLALLINVQFCYAKDYTLKFNGHKYHLLYSVKNKDFGGYLNEYYRKGETYNIWTDMVAVHHFPNAYSPIDRIKDFKDYLSSMNVPSALTFNDKKNAAMIDFIMITSDKMPIVLEFNIFKYEKSKKCGSIALQYVRRYAATTTLQVEQIKNDFEKNRKTLIKKVKAYKIPQIVTEDIDKCISAVEINKQNTTENKDSDGTNNDPKGTVVLNIDELNTENVQEASSTEKIENTADISNAEENKCTEDKKQKEDNSEKIKEEKIVADDTVNNDIKANEVSSESVSKEDKSKTEEAPIPQVTDEQQADLNETEIKKKDKKKKKVKEANYIITNDKENFYAKPRTKKELKEIKKQNKKDLKLKNTAYEITNDKNDLIANPRTKKEMKKYKKLKAKQQKKSKNK